MRRARRCAARWPRCGVGSVELSQASVFDSADAEDLERVLAAMLEPQREPLLRAALATEVMGFDAAALQALSADEAALLDAIAALRRLPRQLAASAASAACCANGCAPKACRARLLARPDGERRLTNLLHLAELLHEAAAAHPAPEALLRWLQTQRSDARRDEAAQLRLESDRNLVQIVTIHKSKGLEYPLVFCPLLWDGHIGAARSGGEGVEYHDDDGRHA